MPRPFLVLLVAAVTVVAACAEDAADEASPTSTAPEPEQGAEEEEGTSAAGELEVTMTDAEGAEVGTVSLRPNDAGVRVRADVKGLAPGFHGFHVHEVGLCEADAAEGPFTTAKGHFVGEGASHGDHDGDMPSLYVTDDGRASSTFTLDTFSVEELASGDGAAIMIHAGADNFANIPDRYTAAGSTTPGADQMTNSTGDAGARAACGVIQPAQG